MTSVCFASALLSVSALSLSAAVPSAPWSFNSTSPFRSRTHVELHGAAFSCMRNSSMLNVLMYDKCIINELVAFVSLHLLATYSLVFPSFPSLLLVVNAWRDYNSEHHAWLHWETHWSSELKKSRRRSCLWDVPLGWRGQGLPGEGGRAGGRIMSSRDLTCNGVTKTCEVKNREI